MTAQKLNISRTGINRNILECKSPSYLFSFRCKKVLIETYWNVNMSKQNGLIPGKDVLIETYWNVNIHWPHGIRNVSSVLIETYWNVNILVTAKRILKEDVLIETYWNVNFDEYGTPSMSPGINRNILECKWNIINKTIHAIWY